MSPILNNDSSNEREIRVSRVFNAPRERVFDAWLDPAQLANWWGPHGWDTVTKGMDARVGGEWRYCMQADVSPEPACGKSVYEEIVPPERLVYSDYFTDADGTILPDMPVSKSTVLFEDVDGKTKLTVSVLFASAEDVQAVLDMGMLEGLSQSWDRLTELLA